VVEEGHIFDPYRPSQVHWYIYDGLFHLPPGAQSTLWFSAHYFGGGEPGWHSQDFGHVSIMISPSSFGDGPLEIVKEGVQRARYTIQGNSFFAQTRLLTLHNPTDRSVTFLCRGISAPAFGGPWESRPTPSSPPTSEMNLLVLHDDQEGGIIASRERHVTQSNLASCGFVPDEGQQVVEVSPPEEISRLGFSEIYENFVVDVEAEQPTLKRKSE
jgi:hypothetical protein